MELPPDWERRVRDALLPVRPDLADAPFRPLGAGLDSVALVAETPEGPYVLRFPKGRDAAESVAREASLLPELAPRLELPIPVFAFTAPNPLGPGVFGCYPIVPGESLSPEQWAERGLLDAPEPPRQIAAFLDAVHAFPAGRALELGAREWDMRADYAGDLAGVRAHVVPHLPPGEASALLRTWEAYLADDANFAYRPTFVHADVSLDHLLVTGDRVTGVIDFGDAEVADPDYDLNYLWAEAGTAFVRRVQAARGRELTARQLAKLRFWAWSDLANDVVHAVEHDLPDLREESLTELRELLAAGTG